MKVPTDPVKPDSHSRPFQWPGRYSERCGSLDGTMQASMPWRAMALRNWASRSARVSLVDMGRRIGLFSKHV